MTYLFIFFLLLAVMAVFFVGMALFLISLAYFFSFFTGKKEKAPGAEPPMVQESLEKNNKFRKKEVA
jgi:mannose/fructose/N-acetylgalactosamine-specific phosphotransferase system component IIC